MCEQVMVARAASNVVYHHGRRVVIRKGRTTAHASHPIVAEHPNLWEPLRVDYPAPEPQPGPELVDTSTLDQEPGTQMLPAAAGPPAPGPVPDPPARGDGADDPAPEPTEPKPAEVRAWAREAGIEVSASGKVPAEIVEQYKAAHGG